MKKDILLAIFIGLVFGMFAAFLVIFLPTITKSNKKNQQAVAVVSPTPVSTQKTTDIQLDITSPEDNSVFTGKSVTLEGSTKNSVLVVLDSDIDTSVISASETGSFTQDITLTEGSNKFTITAYDEKGITLSKTLILYYTPEKI